jgi:acyl transferase domain-containing protein
VSINSFGFGGVNVHVVLEANSKRTPSNNASRDEMRLALMCARTADGCEKYLKRLKECENNIELQALLAENALHPSNTHPYRGFGVLNSSEISITVKVTNNKGYQTFYLFRILTRKTLKTFVRS